MTILCVTIALYSQFNNIPKHLLDTVGNSVGLGLWYCEKSNGNLEDFVKRAWSADWNEKTDKPLYGGTFYINSKPKPDVAYDDMTNLPSIYPNMKPNSERYCFKLDSPVIEYTNYRIQRLINHQWVFERINGIILNQLNKQSNEI